MSELSVVPPLLKVENLSVSVPMGRERTNAVEDVCLEVRPGEAVGLVGESGSGKSLTLRAILRLLPPAVSIASGQVWFDGVDMSTASRSQIRAIRGRGIAMIFQDPLAVLNPIMRVGDQIVDAARRQQGWNRSEARSRAVRLARQMGIPDAEACLAQYPHELSGGLRQRVMIAAALARGPKLVLCDEPTTALDVTIQDQILRLLASLQAEMRMSMLYVSHDLAVVAQLCQRIEVMYAGRIVESGPTSEVFRSPQHPYTRGLLRATPDVDGLRAMEAMPGAAPSPGRRPSGCAFRTRCELADDDCGEGSFPLSPMGPDRMSACIHVDRMQSPTTLVENS